MLSFPQLKSGAIMQYPASRSQEYATNIVQFLDGSEQRFRIRRAAGQRWMIRLELLDDSELDTLERFVVSVQGTTGKFEFLDPFDNRRHASCSLEAGSLKTVWSGFGRGETVLIITQRET